MREGGGGGEGDLMGPAARQGMVSGVFVLNRLSILSLCLTQVIFSYGFGFNVLTGYQKSAFCLNQVRNQLTRINKKNFHLKN